jgi:hypothetical protein
MATILLHRYFKYIIILFITSILYLFASRVTVLADYQCGYNICNDSGQSIGTVTTGDGCPGGGPCGDPIYPPSSGGGGAIPPVINEPVGTSSAVIQIESDKIINQTVKNNTTTLQKKPSSEIPPNLYHTCLELVKNEIKSIQNILR